MSDEFRDITSLVEQLPAFEERLGVRIESVYAVLRKWDFDETYTITVTGELHSDSGLEIPNDIQLVLSASDFSGRIIGKSTDEIDRSSFYGLHVFEITMNTSVGEISRLRIHPASW